MVRSDPVLLRSILQNLISNAIRYTATGGVIVGTRRRGNEWRIDVVDTGIGIAPDQIAAIFQEFHQVRRGGSGIGLGLAIVERSARLIGASLEVASEPGRGSRFSLTLPAAEGEQHSRPPVPPRPIMGTHDILVVDDDAHVCEAMVAHLSAAGHRTSVAHDAASALALAPRCTIALVDFDLGDPATDGLRLIEALRRAQPHLACALITADISHTVTDRARTAQVALLNKPLAPATLDAWLGTIG